MVYSLQQLIDEWKLRRGLEPVRSDAVFHRFDALDLDAYIGRIVDAWYRSLLDSGPTSALIPHDIAGSLTIVDYSPTKVTYSLPDNCRRIISVNVYLSRPPAIIADPDSPLARRQECPFSRGEAGAPVAVRNGDFLSIYHFRSLPQAPPDRLLAILTPPVGSYELSDSAFDLIPDSFNHETI